MSFEPNFLVFTAKPSDAEILFRALSYSTGQPPGSRFTLVLMCAWLFVYPYMTGEMNYSATGISYGIRL